MNKDVPAYYTLPGCVTVDVINRTPVSRSRIADLVCCALEGGSTYWCHRFKPDIYPISHTGKSVEWGHEAVAYGAGFTIEHDDDSVELHVANSDNHLARTLALMSEQYPKQWADFRLENEDADTGDLFFQLLCFGEVVYG